MTATEMTPARSVTGRGFTIYDEFTDTYGNRVRVQQSSSAMSPRVWIFTEDDSDATTSPHLDITQAERVRDALDAFITEQKEMLQAEGLAAADVDSP